MFDAATMGSWIGALGLAFTTRQDGAGGAMDLWLGPDTVGDLVATIAVQGPSVSLVAHERRVPRGSLASTWPPPHGARDPLVGVTVAAVRVAAGFSLVTATVRDGGDNVIVRFEAPVYHDGLTQQAFLITVSSVIKAGQAFEGLAAQNATEVRPSQPRATDVQAAVSQTSPAPAATSWTASHVVPAGGLPAWQAPDPASPQILLAPSLPVQVVEVRGDWARVVASNGWTGWVDGRRLTPRS